MQATVKLNFTQAGHYWLNDRKLQSSLDLGYCESEKQLRKAVIECMDAGDADWTGWTADRG